MNLSSSLKKIKFDKRMLDWNLAQGLITPQEHQEFLQNLDDLSSKTVKIDLEKDRNNQSSL